MDMEKLVIGIDYGTDSCRAVALDTASGKELATAISGYIRWKKGLYCDPSANRYRQHPQDYIDSLVEVIHDLLAQLSPDEVKNIVALGIDTTGSTPCLTDRDGTPLALLPEYADDPDAMFILWKDHTSIREADEINALARKWETDFTSRSGGIYSSEWFWAKALHVLRANKKIREKACSIIEHCDWMPALLTGNLRPEQVKRSRCAAGHKGMWASAWGGYPSQEFLSALDPLFGGFATRLENKTYTSDVSAGKLTDEWAERLGLPHNVDVAVGILDAHAGAIGAGITAHTMVKIVGTSTCDIVVTPKKDIAGKLIPGISGQVDGSVIPGLIGLEAGQSAFGDVYAWWKEILSWSLNLLPEEQKREIIAQILQKLTEEAEKLPVTESDPVATDWLNGRRTPFADLTLKGGIAGITLATTPAHIFKSLVEATAFGSRAIMEHLEKEGVQVNEVIGVGGISLKSSYVMQTLSDIMGVPIKVAATQQAGALGAAMCAAVAAGVFHSMESALESLGQGYKTVYVPRVENRETYDVLYEKYRQLNRFLEAR
ncbi:Ribulokinase [Proteiniphilum saccharofermentans]|uniref:Ribulokinase n=1 Tax=Proteiniphilum saccharofermentans TaxID=1642647 RepID=A0A1R3T4D3_9BACT|nr:ribulokinase [Proteiniphilum saccharofermentans]SCD18855.1 Ribulokinase [Proteiniphilum saccharofermentans]